MLVAMLRIDVKHKLPCQVWLRRVYRAFELMLFCSVVLHDSWCVGVAFETEIRKDLGVH